MQQFKTVSLLMHILYTPWRAAYGGNPETGSASPQKTCPFCLTSDTDDRKLLVLKRYEYCYILMNHYPYNPAHVMVIPYVHVPTPTHLPDLALAELMQVTAHAMRMIQKVVPCQGFNVGMNIGGGVSGGTVPDHIHQHVLPRWIGDTGFTVALAHTKAMAYAPDQLYEQLHSALQDCIVS